MKLSNSIEFAVRLGGFAGVLIAVLHTPHALAQDPNATRQAELVKLVRQDCGSCHGARLTGGLGPALTPNALMDRPREAMIATILRGRLGTPMPPWAPFLSEREAEWIFDRLLAGFPEELAHAH